MVDLLPFLKHLSNSALSHPHIRSCSSVAKTRLVETGREVVVLVKKAILVYGYASKHSLTEIRKLHVSMPDAVLIYEVFLTRRPTNAYSTVNSVKSNTQQSSNCRP